MLAMFTSTPCTSTRTLRFQAVSKSCPRSLEITSKLVNGVRVR